LISYFSWNYKIIIRV